ncbi:antitoxin [Rhodococcus sp. RS1C4]|uniref:antitoxin n=1 Tax=Nocardiaceae TaxID=85025 RepID=UPI00037A342C|nr:MULTISPECIES: antitoxin [Rhodococcus]OZC55292.1 antitoxin [Rhodococcus sp. 06-621-2]OZC58389.1 antitoxin [Rhodococcus sp. RS1C4]OZC88222.1 antitoxin [Rhodococcus sp. 06-418-1B]OZD11795.1 antitoxin [Rhodococcus sp. 06-156-4C]OZD15639.1 antitoxin [Rhodococcus sp. 06-156-4a]
MGFADNLKGIVDKGKELAAENSDKIEDVVDKAGDFIDDKTGGKYADKVDKVQEAAKKAIPDKP